MKVDGAEGLYHCKSCTFIYAPDIQSEDAHLYNDSFGENNVHPTYAKYAGKYVVRNREKMEHLLSRLQKYRQTGRILDIGCSAAFFLMVAKEAGWQPQGVEIAPWAAEFSNKELGVNVFNGVLQDAHFPDNHFDIVFSSHVMEHIASPSDLLNEMTRILRPGGVHVTVIPTQFASPSWKITSQFYGDPPPFHVSYYTSKTYSAFLKKAGLNVVSAEYNIELSRLRSLTVSKEQSLQNWRSNKKKELDRDPNSIPQRPAWLSSVKYVTNKLGNMFDMGDEILVIAEKPLVSK